MAHESLESWLGSYEWLRERDLECIVSADLDGIACAAWQASTLGWTAVGTYDGVSIHLYKDPSLINWQRVVFLDLEILRPDARSIGNHMCCYDAAACAKFKVDFPHCVNPNVWRGVTFEPDFSRKYPFGTLPLLIAATASRDPGLKVSEPWISLCLHVDSGFTNAATYQRNCLEWLSAMAAVNSPALKAFCTRISRVPTRRAVQMLDDVQQFISSAKFGPKQRACRFNPSTEAARAATLISGFDRFVGVKGGLPFGTPVVFKEFLSTASAGLDKGKRKASVAFAAAFAARSLSLAATGRTDKGLSYTLPNPSSTIPLFH